MPIDLLWGVISVIVFTTAIYILRNAIRDGTIRTVGLIYVVIGMLMVGVATALEALRVIAPGFGEPLFSFLRLVVFFMGGALFVVRGLYNWSPLGAEVRRQYSAAQRELAERVKAEAALREAHDQLEQRVLERTLALREANRHLYLQALTFATLAEGVVVTNLNGVALDANPAAAQIFGYDSDRIIGKEIKVQLFEGIPFRNWRELLQEVKEHGQWTGDLLYHHPNGNAIILNCRVVLFHNDRYEAEGFIAVGRDITAQRSAEDVVRRHSLAFENLSESIILLSESGVILDCNPATTTIFGVSRSDFIGKPLQEWASVPISEAVIAQIGAQIQDTGRWQGTMPIARPDGTTGTLAITVLQLYDERSAWQGSVILSRDITEQVRAEAERRRNEALLQSVLQSAPARIAVLNDVGERMLTNQIWNEDFGDAPVAYPAGDLRQGAPLLPPESPESTAVAAGIRAVLDGDQPNFTYEYGVDLPTGSRWYLLQVTPLLAEQGGVVISHVDISERKMAQHNLLRQERLALLGRLSATLAHEINNPLQAIRLNLDLALDFKLPQAQQRDVLDTVRNEIERLNDGTVRVLNFARVRRRTSRRVEPRDVVYHTLQLLHQEHERKGIRVVVNCDPTPAVAIDPDELTQVCLNLLLNGRDSLPNGGTQSIHIYEEGGWVALEFANDGPPMPTDVLARLFEPFFTTKGEGTGLGLYTCQSILEQYGGRIRGENLPDHLGVRFSIWLPAMQPSTK